MRVRRGLAGGEHKSPIVPERRFDGVDSLIICSGAGRLRSFEIVFTPLRVEADEVVLTTDRGGEIGFFLKRLRRK